LAASFAAGDGEGVGEAGEFGDGGFGRCVLVVAGEVVEEIKEGVDVFCVERGGAGGADAGEGGDGGVEVQEREKFRGEIWSGCYEC